MLLQAELLLTPTTFFALYFPSPAHKRSPVALVVTPPASGLGAHGLWPMEAIGGVTFSTRP